MRRPASVTFFGMVFPVSGLILLGLAIWPPSETGLLLRGVLGVGGLAMVLSGLGLLMGDNGSRVVLLWISAVVLLASIWQFAALMLRVEFGWLTDGLSLRELLGPARFVLSMIALSCLSGSEALAYCRRRREQPSHSW